MPRLSCGRQVASRTPRVCDRLWGSCQAQWSPAEPVVGGLAACLGRPYGRPIFSMSGASFGFGPGASTWCDRSAQKFSGSSMSAGCSSCQALSRLCFRRCMHRQASVMRNAVPSVLVRDTHVHRSRLGFAYYSTCTCRHYSPSALTRLDGQNSCSPLLQTPAPHAYSAVCGNPERMPMAQGTLMGLLAQLLPVCTCSKVLLLQAICLLPKHQTTAVHTSGAHKPCLLMSQCWAELAPYSGLTAQTFVLTLIAFACVHQVHSLPLSPTCHPLRVCLSSGMYVHRLPCPVPQAPRRRRCTGGKGPRSPYVTMRHPALDHDAPLGLVGARSVPLRQAAREQAVGVAAAQQRQLRHQAGRLADILCLGSACMCFIASPQA